MRRDNKPKTWMILAIPTILLVMSIPLMILLIVDRSLSAYVWIVPMILLLSGAIIESWVLKHLENKFNTWFIHITILLIMASMLASTIIISFQTEIGTNLPGILMPLLSLSFTLIGGGVMVYEFNYSIYP